MATLDDKKIKRKRKKIRRFLIAFFLLVVVTGPYFAALADQGMKAMAVGLKREHFEMNYSIIYAYKMFFGNDVRIHQIYLLLLLAALMIDLWLYLLPGSSLNRVDTMKITDDIEIPAPVGNGQCGTARFLTLEEVEDNPDVSTYIWGEEPKEGKGGLVVGAYDIKKGFKKKEKWFFVSEDIHTITLGATRSGKNRRIIFRSIILSLIFGESALVLDIKGENWTYTHLFARKKGYKDYNLDLREPEKGMHYNFLQPILDAMEEGDTAQAVESTWDLVGQLVGEAKGEPIWHNGECASIAASVLIIVTDAPEEYKNLTNVYYFLAFMCKPDAFGNMPFTAYLDSLPDIHPAKGVFAMASIAHEKTRGSFFSSALGTLKHFTNPKIAEMTSKSDFRIQDLTEEKSIIYLIVPDEKTTLYPLATLFMDQLSMIFSKKAIENGGRLPIDWNIFADEFGQYPCMPNLPSQISVQAGRGIRWHLFLQSYQQLDDKYDKRSKTIKDNCLTTVYLKSPSPDTNKEISERLGPYTVPVRSASSSVSDAKMNNVNYSNSSNMQSRELLKPDEVGLIKTPYLLFMDQGYRAAVMELPDIGKSKLNEALGMGSKKHNQRLTLKRAKERKARAVSDIKLWGIWKEYQLSLDDVMEENNTFENENMPETASVSFL